MSNMVVDNKELDGLADAVERLIKSLKIDIDFLRDENADIFNRYMAYNKLRSLLKGVDLVMSVAHKSMIAGHNLQDEMFHTEAGIKNGWDHAKTDDHPFFIDADKKDSDDDIPDFLKKMIAGAFLSAMVDRASNDKKN